MSSSQEQSPHRPVQPTSPQASQEAVMVGSGTAASYSSPHRRRGQTRREALDRILKNRSSSSRQPRRPAEMGGALEESPSTGTTSGANSPEKGARQAPQHDLLEHKNHGPQRQRVSDLSNRLFMNSISTQKPNNDAGGGNTVTTASTAQSTVVVAAGYSPLPDDHSDKTPPSVKKVIDDSGDNASSASSSAGRPHATPARRNPQHLDTHNEEEAGMTDATSTTRYYRIRYKGVVALLSEPHPTAPKSGAYISYGEIIMSRHQVSVDEESTLDNYSTMSLGISPKHSMGSDLGATHESPPQSVLTNAGSVSSLDTLRTASTAAPSQVTQCKSQATTTACAVTRRLVRVDKVLTGGYAVDATDQATLLEQQQQEQQPSSPTPPNAKDGSNLHYVPMVGPSPLPLAASSTQEAADDSDTNCYGYLYTRKRNVIIAEQMSGPPTLLQSGTFLFKIVSSAPLTILTGPHVDAPRTRAMLLPGTIHEVCLKMTTEESDVCFLRLSHRRGWITDRRVTAMGGIVKIGAVPAVKDVTDVIGEATDDTTVSAVSLASASFASTGSSVRRRHRPPRRKREAAAAATNEKSGLPRHVGGQVMAPSQSQITPTKGTVSSMVTPQMNLSPGRAHDKQGTPSSNVSILSDDESFELGSPYRSAGGLTPDRSVSSARRQQLNNEADTFFLMRVNVPRGLKILDAPHFQVSSLIHGTNDSAGQSSAQIPGAKPPASKGSGSIFQTMSTHHTTKVKVVSPIGNPAVFDSITKTRILPRGVVFEASKRMESSGAFNRGAGLIKLSDNSGWAIVPKLEEIEVQYRHFQGRAGSVREGEATRAFEEVGNAVVETENSTSPTPSIWVRVVAKNGVSVSCPPPIVPVSKDTDVSPTSSAGDSSILSGGGSNYGALSGSGSDVASSVGSAFLDAMFRTPKRRPSHGIENRTLHEAVGRRRGRRPVSHELQDIPNLLPCGSCVQVERWEDTSNDVPGVRKGRCQDYVRLRGGQGWIPFNLSGKTVAAVMAKPDIRLGSFWFRVTSLRGIKVRQGPSRKAGSIKSDDGVYFRFECGEFLRASEIITFFHHDEPAESFAKLYRNRHVRLNQGDDSDFRQLLSMTTPAEWVQVHSEGRLFLEECGAEPQILRHREGWRYNVVVDSGVSVRVGPSFDAEETGVSLLAGESVVCTERVIGPGEESAWLRMKDGDGWVCDSDRQGRPAMIAHSLRHRTNIVGGGPQKAPRSEHEAGAYNSIKYNSIVARLFQEGIPNGDEGIHGKMHAK